MAVIWFDSFYMLDGAIGMAISITRRDRAAELRFEATRARDGGSAPRMLALALVLEGRSRTEGAINCGMDRQTLRDWVHRHSAEGLAGLKDRHRFGRRARLTAPINTRKARPAKSGLFAVWIRQDVPETGHGNIAAALKPSRAGRACLL
jgi:hypothetical protein